MGMGITVPPLPAAEMPSHSELDTEKSSGNKEKMLQAWLDQNQYTRKGILRYEAIFGKTWVSVGGESTTRQFVAHLDLKPGMKVLDIGCGIGGQPSTWPGTTWWTLTVSTSPPT